MIEITAESKATGAIDVSILDSRFAERVHKLGISNLTRCYQCLRCANGCPVAFAMDYTPTQIMRMASMGMKDEVLNSSTIWLCASCQTCTTRCPMDIDIAGVMDAMKEIAIEEGIQPKEKNIRDMHEIFNNIVKTRGRLYEPMLLGHYKLKTRTFAQDMDLGRKMMAKRKIRLWSPKIKGARKVQAMMNKIKNKKGDSGS